MGQPPEVKIVGRDRMSLLGLMLGKIIENNLAFPRKAARAQGIKGRLGVTGGRMSLTIAFDGDTITIERGLTPPLGATIRGSLDGLLYVSIGGGILRSFFSGDIFVSGNPILALKALPLFRVERPEDGEA